MKVWKYVLSLPVNYVPMAIPGRIVHVAKDPASDNAAVWALADPRFPEYVKRELHVVMTGETIGPDLAYVGTAHLPADGLVLHVFEGPIR